MQTNTGVLKNVMQEDRKRKGKAARRTPYAYVLKRNIYLAGLVRWV